MKPKKCKLVANVIAFEGIRYTVYRCSNCNSVPIIRHADRYYSMCIEVACDNCVTRVRRLNAEVKADVKRIIREARDMVVSGKAPRIIDGKLVRRA